MHSQPGHHETILATGGQNILRDYGDGKAKAGREIVVIVANLTDRCGRALAERVLPAHELDTRFGLEGGTAQAMTGACSFAVPLERFAPGESGRELLAFSGQSDVGIGWRG